MANYRQLELEDYLLVLKRSKWWLIIPCLVVGVVALGYSFILPDEYRSETLILVERQQVPAEYVSSTVTADLQDRLQTMTQEILSRTRLRRIIEKFGLFRDYTERQARYRLVAFVNSGLARLGMEQWSPLHQDSGDPAIEELIAKMRESIGIELVRRDRRGPVVTAFKISFIAATPRLAQQVTTEITSLFIEENLTVHEQMAENTSQFIEIELEAARRELEGQESTLKDFKIRYMGQLPEQVQTKLHLLGQLQFQLQANMDAVERLQEQNILLKDSQKQREAVLETQVGAQAGVESPTNLGRQLAQLQAQLSQMKARYTPQHPDVIKLAQQIAQLQTQLEQAAEEPTEEALQSNPVKAFDPQLVQIQSQIEVNQRAQQARLKEQKRIERAIKTHQQQLRLIPLREQQYIEITRDYGIARNNYESLLQKKNRSDLAGNLEKRQQGEQFRILDPANLPAKPFRPYRALISVGGALGGLLLGLIWVGAHEFLNRSLRNERDVEFYLELPVLTLIPLVSSPNHKRRFSTQPNRQGAARGPRTQRAGDDASETPSQRHQRGEQCADHREVVTEVEARAEPRLGQGEVREIQHGRGSGATAVPCTRTGPQGWWRPVGSVGSVGFPDGLLGSWTAWSVAPRGASGSHVTGVTRRPSGDAVLAGTARLPRALDPPEQSLAVAGHGGGEHGVEVGQLFELLIEPFPIGRIRERAPRGSEIELREGVLDRLERTRDRRLLHGGARQTRETLTEGAAVAIQTSEDRFHDSGSAQWVAVDSIPTRCQASSRISST